MKKIFVFALMAIAILLAAAVIPQVQAVGWNTYNDPKGRFSIDYPADWNVFAEETAEGGGVRFDGPNDLVCGVLIIDNPYPGILTGKICDGTTTEEGTTSRTVMICTNKYWATITGIAPSKDFDSANEQYFEHMIRSVKVK